jgi:hypothetical protein
MGRYSPSKSYIIIDCSSTPELHDKFYDLKRQARYVDKKIHNNREFVEFMLELVKRSLADERRRRIVTSY